MCAPNVRRLVIFIEQQQLGVIMLGGFPRGQEPEEDDHRGPGMAYAVDRVKMEFPVLIDGHLSSL